jgi:hypothetical protein
LSLCFICVCLLSSPCLASPRPAPPLPSPLLSAPSSCHASLDWLSTQELQSLLPSLLSPGIT